jgi:hypothetical protein
VVQSDIADPVWTTSWQHMIGSAGNPIEIRYRHAGHRSPPGLRAVTHHGEHSESGRDHDERPGSSEAAIPTRYFEEASSVGLQRSVVYGLSTLRVVVRYVLHRLRVRRSHKLTSRRPAR